MSCFRLRSVTPVHNTPVYLYLSDEIPTLSFAIAVPQHCNPNEIKDDPIFLSTNKTLAKQWRYFSIAFAPAAFTVPVNMGNTEYVLMTTPNGTVYAYGLNDNGTFYVEQFDNGVPVNRHVVMTIMHKGKLVYVADNRQPIPRPGD